MNLTDLAISGPLLLAAMLAIAAGTVSFASPCCLPLVPGYLAYLAGLVGAEPPPLTGESRRSSGRWRVAGAALLFVGGFTVVFASATVAVLGLSDALLANEQVLQRIGDMCEPAWDPGCWAESAAWEPRSPPPPDLENPRTPGQARLSCRPRSPTSSVAPANWMSSRRCSPPTNQPW